MSKVNYNFYTKNSGVEFLEGYKFEKTDEGIKKAGRVNLRFFTLSGDPLSWKFIMDPAEAFALSMKVLEIVRNGGSTSLAPHQFENQESQEKVISTLSIESWENNDRKGYAVKLTRRDETINVPMDAYNFLFLSELLKKASVDQTWTSYESLTPKSYVNSNVDNNTKTSILENELSEAASISASENSDEPVRKPSAQTTGQSSNSSNSKDKTKFLNVPILAISEDMKKIQIKDKWLDITNSSKINTELIEGSIVNAYYNGNSEVTALYAGRA